MLNLLQTKLDIEGLKKVYQLSKQIPFKTYIPTLPIARLIREIGLTVPKKRIFLVTSGNGAGKTAAGQNIIANIVWGNESIYRNVVDIETGDKYPGFFNYPFFNNFPASWPKNIWYISNKQALEEAIWPEFQKWIPSHLYTESKKGHSYVSYVKFHHSDGWKLYYKTDEQEPKTFESANVSVILFDEPPPRQLFIAAVSRLRVGGIIIILATPLMHAAWFVDDIIEQISKEGLETDKHHQTVSVWTNCKEKSGSWDLGIFGKQLKGNLAQDNIEFQLRNYKLLDPDELEARESGKFKHLSGLVYKTYDREKHFVDVERLTNPGIYMYRFILDPHDRKPPAAAWVRFDKYGRRSYIREWPSIADKEYRGLPFNKIKHADPYTVKDFVTIFIKIMREIGIRNNRLVSIIDPNFGRKPNRVTGKMVFEEYQEEFDKQDYPVAFITTANDDIPSGHKKVKELLKPAVNGDILMEIDKSCTNIDQGFRTYSFDEWEGKAAEKRTINEKVKEIGKDFMDLLRYDAVVPFYWDDLDINIDPYEDKDYDTAPKATKEAGWKEKIRRAVPRPAGAKGI